MALASSGDGAAVVASNVSIPRDGVKAMPVTYRGMPIGRWVFVAWDGRRFFPPITQHFVDELARHVRRSYPGRDITKRVPLPLAEAACSSIGERAIPRRSWPVPLSRHCGRGYVSLVHQRLRRLESAVRRRSQRLGLRLLEHCSLVQGGLAAYLRAYSTLGAPGDSRR